MRFDARKLTAVALLALVLLVIPLVVGKATWGKLVDLQTGAVRDAVSDSHGRVRAALDAQFHELCRTLEDWSAWDAMYGFASDPTDEKWREENFAPDSVASLGLCRIALFDLHEKLVLKSDYDLAGGEAADYQFAPADAELIAGLDEKTDLDNTRGGVYSGPGGQPCWVAVKPIRRSDKSGPIVGFLMMVRPLTHEILEQISVTTGAEVTTNTPEDAGGEKGDDAEAFNSSLELSSWDGHHVANLSVACPVRSIMQRHETLRDMFIRAGIVVYVILSAASLLTFAVVWTRTSDHVVAGAASRTGHIPVILSACAGLACTAAATWGVLGWQDQTHRTEFARRAGNFAQLVRSHLASRLEGLQYCQAYFHNTEAIDEPSFDRLITNAKLWHPGVRAWAWIPNSDNPASEQRAGLIATPATAAEPIAQTLVEWPAFRAACEHARDIGEPVGFVMPSDPVLSPAARTVGLVAPIYGSGIDTLLEHRRREYEGVLLSIVELDKVTEHSARQMDYGGMTLEVVGVTARPALPNAVDDSVDGLLVRRCSVNVAAGLTADLSINASGTFRYGVGPVIPMAVAGFGLVLTGLLCAFIEVHLQRTRRVEHLVGVRTSQLEQRTQELLAANAQVEEAHRAKSAFLANMSHELRTPLTAILGYADLLGEAQHAPEAREDFVRTIRRSGEHLLALINDVLDLSKIEAGRMQVERISCSTVDLVEDSVALLRERANRKRIQLAVEYIGAIPATISTDPTRFRQVLVNLIGNAVKFTDAGGVRVLVRLGTPATDANPVLSIEVVDTGPGIEPAVMARLFRPFEQGDGSMSRRFGGSGLGLSISRQLAEMLGGAIHASSHPGDGSSFCFTSSTGSLEGVALIDPSQPRRSGVKSPSGDDMLATDCTGARILLADDTVDNQRLLKFHLQKLKADIVIVNDGREALDAVRTAIEQARPFDLVLMDMQMPVMDGYTAVRTLRAVGITVPVIALTAHSSAADEKRCLETGCDGFLSKPVDRNELVNECKKFIQQSRAARAARHRAA